MSDLALTLFTVLVPVAAIAIPTILSHRNNRRRQFIARRIQFGCSTNTPFVNA